MWIKRPREHDGRLRIIPGLVFLAASRGVPRPWCSGKLDYLPPMSTTARLAATDNILLWRIVIAASRATAATGLSQAHAAIHKGPAERSSPATLPPASTRARWAPAAPGAGMTAIPGLPPASPRPHPAPAADGSPSTGLIRRGPYTAGRARQNGLACRHAATRPRAPVLPCSLPACSSRAARPIGLPAARGSRQHSHYHYRTYIRSALVATVRIGTISE